MLHAMRDMIAQDLFLDPPQCSSRRGDLRDDINAVAIVVDHTGEAAYLAFDPFKAF